MIEIFAFYKLKKLQKIKYIKNNILKEINKNITLLDVGSGLDPIFGEKTRPKQPSQNACIKYYKEILPDNFVLNKTKIAITQINKISSNF